MTFSNQSFEQQSIQPKLMDYITEDRLRDVLPDFKVSYGEVSIESKQDPFRLVEFFFRKTAHVVAYGLLATFAYIALSPFASKLKWKVVLSLLSVLAVASLDEWNQAQMSTRTGAIQDVGLDLIGGCIGIAITVFIVRRRKLKRFH